MPYGVSIPVGYGLALAMLVTVVSQVVPATTSAWVDAWLGRRSLWVLAGMAAVALVVVDALGPDGVAAFCITVLMGMMV